MFPYRRATIDCGFELVNDLESIDLSFVIKCFLMGAGFLGHGGLGASFITDFQLSQTAEPKDYIYSVACEV